MQRKKYVLGLGTFIGNGFKYLSLFNSDLKPWSANFVMLIEDAIVFEDLNALKYESNNKFSRFDVQHTLQALEALARFHGSSILYEEKRRTEQKSEQYLITDDFPVLLEKSGYKASCPWFQQCMKGALESVKTFSNYDNEKIIRIESSWVNIWNEAISLSSSSKLKKVICHRDLWNNNILFHYRKDGKGNFQPDDCVFVDFQAYEYEPQASDVMLLLYCNLEPIMREENMDFFLNYYYGELKVLLMDYGICLEMVIAKEEFLKSAEEYRKFAAVVCSCLMPQFWLDDNLATEIFTNTERFNDILWHNKAEFIKTMMENNYDYKQKVMEIFEEIVERYCI